MTKQQLFEQGRALALRFCEHNSLEPPRLIEDKACIGSYGWYVGSSKTVYCDVNLCKPRIITNWSYCWTYPGYTADLTPYGVVAHELGHHIHFMMDVRATSKSFKHHVLQHEHAVTSYGKTSVHEAIAESFKVFLTNPDLLNVLYPRHYEWYIACGLKPVIEANWRTILKDSPRHTMAVLRKL